MKRSEGLPLALAASMVLGFPLCPLAAEGMPNSTRMTCAQAAGLVAGRGTVLMTTSTQDYNRYVRSRAYCATGEDTHPEWVHTRDSGACFVGYSCFDTEFEGTSE